MAGDDPGSAGSAAAASAEGFERFYDATSTAAFSLAFRITGDRAAAEAACEQAYLEAWHQPETADSASLLELVRERALGARGPSVDGRRGGLNAALAEAEPLGRRAVELAYFGGLSVAEVASILDSTPEEVRRAMRAAMLSMAAATASEGPR